MAKLTTSEKQLLEKLFHMESWFVIDFSDRTFEEFFRDDLDVEINAEKYIYKSGSKANRLRWFWLIESNQNVGKSILNLIQYILNKIQMGELNDIDYPINRIDAARSIAERLLGPLSQILDARNKSNASYKNWNINIQLQKEVFDHVQKLLHDGHYFNAVEEAYKIVRKKLEEVSWYERATDAFKPDNLEKIFGHTTIDPVESDFFEGIKFLHMAIQFLRNEKAHTPAQELDPNLAIHYISLASLAYDLINRKK